MKCLQDIFCEFFCSIFKMNIINDHRTQRVSQRIFKTSVDIFRDLEKNNMIVINNPISMKYFSTDEFFALITIFIDSFYEMIEISFSICLNNSFAGYPIFRFQDNREFYRTNKRINV